MRVAVAVAVGVVAAATDLHVLETFRNASHDATSRSVRSGVRAFRGNFVAGDFVAAAAGDLRDAPGCRDALLDAGADARYRDAGVVMRTRESDFRGARRNQPSGPYGYGHRRPRVTLGHVTAAAVVRGTRTRLVSVVNRKGASRHVGAVLNAVGTLNDSRGPIDPGAYDRTIFFYFVAEPFAKLRSAYREIVDRHAAAAWCRDPEKARTFLCARAFLRMAPDSIERFEAFVGDFLAAPLPSMADLDDGMCYHLFTQSWGVSEAPRVDFVGKLSSLPEDFRALLGAAGADTESLIRGAPGLADLLAPGVRARPPRGAETPEQRLGELMHLRTPPRRPDALADAACLSEEARSAILAYYAQDYACFGFSTSDLVSPGEGADCADVVW